MALKDFMHSLFKEDVEDEEIDEEIVEETPAQTTVEEIHVEAEPVYFHPEPVQTEPKKSGTSIFTGLEIGNAPKEKPASRKKTVRSRTAQPTKTVVEEYQAVISPIFGNVEDEKKQFDKVHNAIELPKPEEGFDMTTVISPMYGSHIPESAPVRSIPAYRRKTEPVGVQELLETTKVVVEEQETLIKEN